MNGYSKLGIGFSLETRVPFLNTKVVELAWRLPLRMKLRQGQTKWVLKRLLYKHVPEKLIDRPKAGFVIPIGDRLRNPLRDWAENFLAEERLSREAYYYPEPVRKKWKENIAGTHDWTNSLWIILMFQAWLENWESQ